MKDFCKMLAVVGVWMAPVLGIYLTGSSSIAWSFILSLFATEVIMSKV